MIDNTALENKLNALNIPGRIVNIKDNAFFCDIYVSFADYVTFAKIKARKTDLEIFLQNKIDITHNAGCVVFRIEKDFRQIESTFNYLTLDIAKDRDYILPLAIGQTENGDKIYIDLVKCPHLLAGGATGSGKSVFLNNCIMSLLFGAKSALCLIDVKRVEFSIYEGLSNLAAPIAYSTKEAKKLLKNICFEMDKRYKVLKDNNCRSISEFNGNMQYLTVVIDEVADLLLQDKSIEPLIVRIAQLGRAAGIHLILATQRPDSTILSGLIRANIPSRVCFSVQKATDSRIILDESGGERLRGSGDGLLKVSGTPTIHFQSPYISTQNIIKFVDHLKTL